MKILILGAGQVGSSLAQRLVSDSNDVTVVDINPEHLNKLRASCDVCCILGNAVHPSVLQAAGAAEVDMLIATTARDEANLVSCHLAACLFNVPKRLARIRSAEFQNHQEITGTGGFYVDHLICPEQTVTDYLYKLIQFPEALQVAEFADGTIVMVLVRIYPCGAFVGKTISDITSLNSGLDFNIVAVFRGGVSLFLTQKTVIEPGDELFLVAQSDQIRSVLSSLKQRDKPAKHIMIAGGGNIGFRLSKCLESRYQVRIIESDEKRCQFLASQLEEKTLVLHGDATDEGVLVQESCSGMDLFIALTPDDENNIMACMLAKGLGARRTIALLNRQTYADLVQGPRIDAAIVPAQTTIGQILAHVRLGDIISVHSLRKGGAEAIELVVHGNANCSKVVGRSIAQIDLPKGAVIAAIIRSSDLEYTVLPMTSRSYSKSTVIIPNSETVIASQDHVIVFVENKASLNKVERLFQMSVGFF